MNSDRPPPPDAPVQAPVPAPPDGWSNAESATPAGSTAPRPPRTGRFSPEDLLPTAPVTRLGSRLTDADLAPPRAPRPSAGNNDFQPVDLDSVKRRRQERQAREMPADHLFAQRSSAASRAATRRPVGREVDVVVDVPVHEMPGAPDKATTPRVPPEFAARAADPAADATRTTRSTAAPAHPRPASTRPAPLTPAATSEPRNASVGGVAGAGDASTRPTVADAFGAANRDPRTAPAAAPAPGRPADVRAARLPLDAWVLRQCLTALGASAAVVFLVGMGWTFFGAWAAVPPLLALQLGLNRWAIQLEHRGHPRLAMTAALGALACMPVLLYLLQRGLGWWPETSAASPASPRPPGTPEVDWRRITIDLGTVAYAWHLFRRHRHPILLAPVTLGLWFTLVECASWVMRDRGLALVYVARVSMLYGLVTVLASHWLWRRLQQLPAPGLPDFAFWPHLIGAVLYWLGLWQQWPQTPLQFALLAVAHGLYGASYRWMRRRVLPVLGTLGVAATLGSWAAGLNQPGLWLQRLTAWLA